MRAPQIPSAPHRSSESRFGRKRKRRRITLIVASVVAIVLAGTAAFAIANYNDLSNGIHRSLITLPSASSAPLPGVTQNTGATNILVMGLDSRLDENGNRLPANVYNALHAGNQSDGGYNTNVLMLIHIPAGGGKAVGISIPRDDYATLAGSPDGVSASKIKEAYGLALDAKLRKLVSAGGITYAEAYQEARAAARQAEITTVSNFLGGVTINHFIEVTMAAFYEVATAVQPITVCLNEATSDAYSGASFPAGIQKLTASQSVNDATPATRNSISPISTGNVANKLSSSLWPTNSNKPTPSPTLEPCSPSSIQQNKTLPSTPISTSSASPARQHDSPEATLASSHSRSSDSV